MFAFKRNSDGTVREARMIAEGYAVGRDEEIGVGEQLPEVAPFKPAPPSSTIDDIVSVLSAAQQTALKARLEARKPIQITATAPKR